MEEDAAHRALEANPMDPEAQRKIQQMIDRGGFSVWVDGCACFLVWMDGHDGPSTGVSGWTLSLSTISLVAMV